MYYFQSIKYIILILPSDLIARLKEIVNYFGYFEFGHFSSAKNMFSTLLEEPERNIGEFMRQLYFKQNNFMVLMSVHLEKGQNN